MPDLRILFFITILLPGLSADPAMAQDCTVYHPVSGKWEYEIHKPKGKVIGYETHQVTGDKVRREVLDKKKEQLFALEYAGTCGFTGFSASPLAWFQDPNIEKFYKHPLKFEAEPMLIPALIDSGHKFPMAGATIIVHENNFPLAEINFVFNKARSNGKKKLTIAGQAYECEQITLWQETVLGVDQPYTLPRKIILFLAPDKGVIRKELYDRKGKMMFYTELISAG